MTTVLVCGGRGYTNRDKVFDVLNRLHRERIISRIVHGNATGADTFADQWAAGKVETIIHIPEWDKYGRAAGPIRNQQMLEEKPDLVVAFPGGKGTQDMVGRAIRAGIKVMFIKEDL